MNFVSTEFLFYFLPLFLCFLYAFRSISLKILTLTLFSYIFYAWWDWRFVFLLLFSTLVDFGCGHAIANTKIVRKRKIFLFLSVFTNLSLLGFFKYYHFVTQNAVQLASFYGLSAPDALLSFNVVLPVGISFYTFQSMSYTIDIYRGVVQPTRNILNFGCYLSMFPQLVAGPIVRYSVMEKQLRSPEVSGERIYIGAQYLIFGLAKKIILADSVAVISDQFFNSSMIGEYSSIDACLAITAYSLQIYFDFSGYSDMAIGLGHFCGYQFPQNFNSPYKARSFADFWRRWHITLSSWLRDYLYIPLGGSQHGAFRTYRNLLITMLLGGLWHGASWNFVIWGAIHGGLLALERFFLWSKEPFITSSKLWFRPVVLLSVAGAWVFFRAHTLSDSLAVYSALFSGEFSIVLLSEVSKVSILSLLVGLIIAFRCPNSDEFSRTPYALKTFLLIVLLLLSMLFLFGTQVHPFLYFQF